jgi:hypothetical protein
VLISSADFPGLCWKIGQGRAGVTHSDAFGIQTGDISKLNTNRDL